MGALTFLTPALLGGLALISIPIIIHLFYRRRFRKIDWAPMRYLKLTLQQNRRSIRIEELLLLLARILVVALLFFLVARPVVQAGGWGALVGFQTRTSQVLVLDDSLSMGFKDGGSAAFDRAKDVVQGVISRLDPRDRVTLVLASHPQTPVLTEAERPSPEDARRIVAPLAVSDAFVSWSATLLAVEELLKSATYPVQVVTVVTDLRRSGWDQKVEPVGDRWASGDVGLRIFDTGSPLSENLTLLSLEPREGALLARTPSAWTATVRNGSGATVDGADMTLDIDGKPGIVRLPAIEPGGTVRVPVSVTFQTAGLHHLALSLPEDSLTADNRRWGVVRARERIHALLVDGDPSVDALGGESDFLSLALSIGMGGGQAWDVETVTESEWNATPVRRADCVMLANVAEIQATRAEELKKFVAAGIGLVIFAGDQLDSDNYNQRLYEGGQGLLPCQVESPEDGAVSGLLLEDVEASPLGALRELSAAVLGRISCHRFLAVREPDPAFKGARVLARWNHPEAPPAAVEKRYGDGHVLLWTVTADKGWGDWPTEPSYVLAMREAAKAVVSADTVPPLNAGDLFLRRLDPNEEMAHPRLEVPGADVPAPLEPRDEPAEEGVVAEGVRGKRLTYPDTWQAGLYRLSWRDSRGEEREDRFAVNFDARETTLDRIEPEELQRLFGKLRPEVVRALSAADATVRLAGREIWRPLAIALLTLALVESVLARWVGRQR